MTGARQKKTPEQRAAEALGTAERVYAKAVEKSKEAAAAHGAAVEAQGKAEARLEYVSQHPDLPEEVRAKYAKHFAGDDEEPVTALGLPGDVLAEVPDDGYPGTDDNSPDESPTWGGVGEPPSLDARLAGMSKPEA